MNDNSIFRLKIQYKGENEENGNIEKIKLEILVQCVNYTDAETVMCKIAEQYQMDKYEPYTYDIVKTKFSAGDIYGGAVLSADDANKSLTCGLLQHFFENESDGLYAVETVVFETIDGKEKSRKETCYIPATDVADAMGAATAILRHRGESPDDFIIPSAKLDNATYIYLRPKTSEEIFNQANDIFN